MARGSILGSAARAAIVMWVLVGLVACDDTLASKEIERSFAGNTLEGKTGEAETYWVYFAPTGDLYMFVPDTGFVDIGRWRTDDGRYCRIWQQIDEGQEHCYMVQRKAGGYEFTRGNQTSLLKLIQGNPHGLPVAPARPQLPAPKAPGGPSFRSP